jgi:hypothetical protein
MEIAVKSCLIFLCHEMKILQLENNKEFISQIYIPQLQYRYVKFSQYATNNFALSFFKTIVKLCFKVLYFDLKRKNQCYSEWFFDQIKYYKAIYYQKH